MDDDQDMELMVNESSSIDCNIDENNSVGVSSIISTIRDNNNNTKPTRRSVHFATDATKLDVPYDVTDCIGSIESVNTDVVTEYAINKSQSECGMVTDERTSIDKSSADDDVLQSSSFHHPVVPGQCISYTDSVNLSFMHMHHLTKVDNFESRTPSDSGEEGSSSVSDGDSHYRFSRSVCAGDDGSNVEDEEKDDNDISVNGNAFESPQQQFQLNVSKRNGRRSLSVISERSTHRQSYVSQRSCTKSEQSNKSQQSTQQSNQQQRKSIINVIRNMITNLVDDNDEEKNIITRRVSRMSMASKAVKEYVVNDDYDEDDDDATTGRRMTRLSMAELDTETLSSIESKVVENVPLSKELYLVICLAIPSMIIEVTTSIPYMLTASYIGRKFEPLYLVGYSLANSLGNISTNMLLLGVFSASDTLSPQAFGAKNYSELGLIALRGFVLANVITMPLTIILFIWMTPILVGLGQSFDAAVTASEWFRVSAFCLPAVIIIQIIWKFLLAQNVLLPLVVISLLCSVLLTPIVLNLFGNSFGYLGTSGSKLFVTICQTLLILLYVQWRKPHHPETWTGIGLQNWKLALNREKFKYFVSLSFGGILANLEYLFWEVITIVVGTIGPLALATHTVNASISFMTFNLGVGFMIALSTRIGNIIPISVQQAQLICLWGSVFSYAVCILVNLIVYLLDTTIINMFTNDPDVIAECKRTWFDLFLFQLSINIFYINSGIATGLGLQWTLGVLTGLFLFGLGMPLIYYYAVINGGGVEAVWRWMWPPYLILSALLVVKFVRADWDQIATFVRIREGMIPNLRTSITR